MRWRAILRASSWLRPPLPDPLTLTELSPNQMRHLPPAILLPAEPGVGPSSAEPGVDPSSDEPGVGPSSSEPGVGPSSAEPGVDPSSDEPGVGPSSSEPGVGPSSVEPNPKLRAPPSSSGTAEPVPTEPGS